MSKKKLHNYLNGPNPAVSECIGQVPDNVNHPPHYKRGKVECIDAVDAITTGMPGTYAHYTATILTYIWRWYFKNGVEDLKKARWYLERLIEKLES